MICYDIRFPLFSALLRRKYDVDVILHPCAFAEDVTFYSWHSFVITRALENLCFFISVNRAGEKWGNSIVCPPWVDGKTKPEIFGKHEQYKEINIDKDHIKKIRKEFPFAEDNFFTSDKGKQNIII